jgi:hypothetical protein
MPDPSRAITGPAIAVLAASVTIMGTATYLLWQTPPESIGIPQKGATIQKRMQRAADSGAGKQTKTVKLKGGHHDNMSSMPSVAPEAAPKGNTSQPEKAMEKAIEKVSALPAPPPPFPNASDIQVGMPKANLVETFGKPKLSAHTMEQERLMEMFVYMEKRDRATFVVLQEGKVISAYTGRLRHPLTDGQPVVRQF